MFAWLRMALAVAVALLPGGLVVLVGWALWRAYRARLREAAAARKPAAAIHALTTVRVGDVVREARQVSGLASPLASGSR